MLPGVSWRIRNQEESADGKGTLSDHPRELLGPMCRNLLPPLVQLKKKKKNPLAPENARFSGCNFLSELLSPSMAERTIRRELQDGRADTSLADPVCRPESLQTSPVRAWAPCRTLWHIPRVSRKFLFFLGVGNGFQERPPSWPQDPFSDDLVGQDIFPLSPDCSLKRVKPRDGKHRCLPCWGVTAKAASAASGSLWSGGP